MRAEREGGRWEKERKGRQSRGQGQDEKGCGVGDCRVLAQGSVPAWRQDSKSLTLKTLELSWGERKAMLYLLPCSLLGEEIIVTNNIY